ncbi:serine/threonine-protein kinase [Paenibacillus sp. sgz302251]|uniref:serine/threonine-protein kinase n=1 Tax=Paenibacillus sp. sgz302251 TaxID=3414493 RepID=UPI003C7ED57E
MSNSEISFSPFARGDRIDGRYRIVGIIGRGGMGVVYAVEDLKLDGMLRAVKVTRAEDGAFDSYSDEAFMLMKLNHPHLPHMIDYLKLEELGCEALVMDYFNGMTIAACRKEMLNGFTYRQIVHIGLQLCSALRYLHQQSPPIVHRDLKPSNVMIDNKGYVKLIDFGISRQYKSDQLHDTVQLGTLGFAAPEQEGLSQSDARTDVYGLGALLYYLASDGVTFNRNQVGGIRTVPFGGFRSNIPYRFKAILERMLQQDPSDRYQSMDEVEYELTQLEFQMVRGYEEDSLEMSMHYQFQLYREKRLLVSVISLSPGAGATFLTFALAYLIGANHVTVSAFEYSELRPEWHALLEQREQPSHAGTLDSLAFDERYLHITPGHDLVSWYPLAPDRRLSSDQDRFKFEQMLRQSSSSCNLIDLSGKWQDKGAESLLQQSRFVFVVGDPSVYK